MTDVMLTPTEVAQRWRVTAETVRKLCRDQELGHIPIGRKYLIPEVEAERFEQRKFVPPLEAERTVRASPLRIA